MEIPEWALEVVGVIGDISHLSGELKASREERQREQAKSEPGERVPDPDFDGDTIPAAEEGESPSEGEDSTNRDTVFGEFLSRMPHLTVVANSFPLPTATLDTLKTEQPEEGDKHVQALLLAQYVEGVKDGNSINAQIESIQSRIAVEETSIDIERLRMATLAAQNEALGKFIDKMEKGLLNLSSTWGAGGTGSAGVVSPRTPKSKSPNSTTTHQSTLNFEARRRRRDKAKDATRGRAVDMERLDGAFDTWHKYRAYSASQKEFNQLAVEHWNLNATLWFYTWMEAKEEGTLGDDDETAPKPTKKVEEGKTVEGSTPAKPPKKNVAPSPTLKAAKPPGRTIGRPSPSITPAKTPAARKPSPSTRPARAGSPAKQGDGKEPITERQRRIQERSAKDAQKVSAQTNIARPGSARGTIRGASGRTTRS